jgi:hypothetical protein
VQHSCPWLVAVIGVECQACRVPARRPGNFHLRPQMKVTKAKGLKAKPLSPFFAPCPPGPAGHLEPPPQLGATTHSTRPRFALPLGPANQRGRGLARPAPPSARRVRCAACPPSGPLDGTADACRTSERCCIQGLCFGDFHLALQMKVTRPPGRDPAGNAVSKGQEKRTAHASALRPLSAKIPCGRVWMKMTINTSTMILASTAPCQPSSSLFSTPSPSAA